MSDPMLTQPDIENRLQEIISSSIIARLPSLRLLARQIGASWERVHEAVRQLQKSGVLRVSRKGGIVIRKLEQVPEGAKALPPEESLYRLMRSRIEAGEYRTGRPLPKTGYLARTEKAGTRTVGRVVRRLVKDGLVYRKGRSLTVGRETSIGRLASPNAGRYILMVQLSGPTWKELTFLWYVQPFIQTFLREMSLYGLLPQTALIKRPRTAQTACAVPAGKAEIEETIKRLGSRLMGILVVDFGAEAAVHYGPELFSFLTWLCGFGKPVVTLDARNEAGPVYLEEIYQWTYRQYLRAITHPDMQKRFFKCHPDFVAIDQLPALALHQAGHRMAGIPYPGKPPGWLGGRLFQLRAAAKSMHPPFTIVTSQELPPLFAVRQEMTKKELDEKLQSTLPRPPAAHIIKALAAFDKRNYRFSDLPPEYKSLAALSPILGPFLNNTGCTAIIAPSDRFARLYYQWFMTASVRIPEDISLISYDDRPESIYPYAVSSVNFGFDDLGYTAFHLILGDIPVRPAKDRSIAGHCRINHYATIGEPGRR